MSITEENYARLDDLATRRGVTKTELIKEAIARLLEGDLPDATDLSELQLELRQERARNMQLEEANYQLRQTIAAMRALLAPDPEERAAA